MKKNTMMRLASVLLIAVLMSTCAISGTFAKYVTSDTGSDIARVAKFGVKVTADSDIFDAEYAKEDTNYAGTISVEATENVVAPGTTKTMANVTLSGEPEVAVRISNKATFDIGDNWTTVGTDFYCPIIITVLDAAGVTHNLCGLDYTSAALFEADVVSAISTATKDYDPNTDLSGVSAKAIVVTWTWAFEGGHADQTDDKDTILGNIAAGGTVISIALTVTTTVTQID